MEEQAILDAMASEARQKQPGGGEDEAADGGHEALATCRLARLQMEMKEG